MSARHNKNSNFRSPSSQQTDCREYGQNGPQFSSRDAQDTLKPLRLSSGQLWLDDRRQQLEGEIHWLKLYYDRACHLCGTEEPMPALARALARQLRNQRHELSTLEMDWAIHGERLYEEDQSMTRQREEWEDQATKSARSLQPTQIGNNKKPCDTLPMEQVTASVDELSDASDTSEASTQDEELYTPPETGDDGVVAAVEQEAGPYNLRRSGRKPVQHDAGPEGQTPAKTATTNATKKPPRDPARELPPEEVDVLCAVPPIADNDTINFNDLYQDGQIKRACELLEVPESDGEPCVYYCHDHKVLFRGKMSRSSCKKHLKDFHPKSAQGDLSSYCLRIVNYNPDDLDHYKETVRSLYDLGKLPARRSHRFIRPQMSVVPDKNMKIKKSSAARKPVNSRMRQQQQEEESEESEEEEEEEPEEEEEEEQRDTMLSATLSPIRPLAGKIYLANWDDSTSYAVMVLPYGSLRSVGLRGSLMHTDLLSQGRRPSHGRDPETGAYIWSKGYEDGGAKELEREYPVIWFNTQDFPTSASFGWVEARRLRSFDALDRSVPYLKQIREHVSKNYEKDLLLLPHDSEPDEPRVPTVRNGFCEMLDAYFADTVSRVDAFLDDPAGRFDTYSVISAGVDSSDDDSAMNDDSNEVPGGQVFEDYDLCSPTPMDRSQHADSPAHQLSSSPDDVTAGSQALPINLDDEPDDEDKLQRPSMYTAAMSACGSQDSMVTDDDDDKRPQRHSLHDAAMSAVGSINSAVGSEDDNDRLRHPSMPAAAISAGGSQDSMAMDFDNNNNRLQNSPISAAAISAVGAQDSMATDVDDDDGMHQRHPNDNAVVGAFGSENLAAGFEDDNDRLRHPSISAASAHDMTTAVDCEYDFVMASEARDSSAIVSSVPRSTELPPLPAPHTIASELNTWTSIEAPQIPMTGRFVNNNGEIYNDYTVDDLRDVLHNVGFEVIMSGLGEPW